MFDIVGRKYAVALALVAGMLLLLAAPLATGRLAREKDPRDLLLEEALRVRVTVDFEVPTDLADIIEFLNEAIAQELPIRHAIHLDPRISRYEPRAVQITMEQVRVRKVLNLLLFDATSEQEELEGNELTYAPYYQGGVIYVTHRHRMRRLNMKRKEIRIYDVRDLLINYDGGGRNRDNDRD